MYWLTLSRVALNERQARGRLVVHSTLLCNLLKTGDEPVRLSISIVIIVLSAVVLHLVVYCIELYRGVCVVGATLPDSDTSDHVTKIVETFC